MKQTKRRQSNKRAWLQSHQDGHKMYQDSIPEADFPEVHRSEDLEDIPSVVQYAMSDEAQSRSFD